MKNKKKKQKLMMMDEAKNKRNQNWVKQGAVAWFVTFLLIILFISSLL